MAEKPYINKRPAESEAMAMAKGKNKYDLPNALFSTADEFFMEVGLIQDSYQHKSKAKNK
jgi:hypothetical protein